MSPLNKRALRSASAVAAVSVIIGIFSFYTPWLGDDVNYAYNFIEETCSLPIRSLHDVFVSQNAHWLLCNGRYVAHFLVQCFCGMWGHGPFAVANALMYAAFLLTLCRLCGVKLCNVRGVCGVIVAVLLSLQTKMVPSCQIGFIWMFTLVIVFLLAFFSRREWRWWQAGALGVLGLAAGNGQEALSLGVSAALVIYWWNHRREMTPAQYVMMICFGAGTLLNCLSPGIRGRADYTVQPSVGYYASGLVLMLRVLRASYLLLAVTLWQKFRGHRTFRQIYASDSFFWNAFIVLMVFNLIIGTESNRQFFGAELMAVVITFRMLRGHSMTRAWTWAFAVALAATYAVQGWMILRNHRYCEEISEAYAAAPDGKIYIDIDQTMPLPICTEFTPFVERYGLATDYNEFMLGVWLREVAPGHGFPKFIPTMLKGRDNDRLGNFAVHLDDDNYLVVKSKDSAEKLYADYRIDLPGFHREFGLSEIDPGDKVLCEGAHWRAWLISVKPYKRYKIGSVRPVFGA